MGQDWHRLLFLHWRVDPRALRARIPAGLELDTFDGDAYVTLAPFTVDHVRPLWLPPLPRLSAFHEVNVRTYVHRGGAQPGVWFFSLDASSVAAVLGARLVYGLHYFTARMRLDVEGPSIAFSSRRVMNGPGCALRYRPRGDVHEASPGDLAFFLVERYLLYTTIAGKLCSARVAHEPYPVQDAEVDGLSEDLLAASGLTRPSTPPLAHYARAVHVSVYPPHHV